MKKIITFLIFALLAVQMIYVDHVTCQYYEGSRRHNGWGGRWSDHRQGGYGQQHRRPFPIGNHGYQGGQNGYFG